MLSPLGAGHHAVLLLALAGTVASCSEPVDLQSSERKVFSQFGEDGVIERIFQVIEPTTKFVVEFGAHDGVKNSNARNLVLNHGWGGLLMEGDRDRAARLAKAYADHPGVKTRHVWIYPGNIDILLEEGGVPEDFDLLVIDIDSNDYYVWRVIHDFRPKVVMIEVNMRFRPPRLAVVDFHPMNYWDRTAYHGASLQSYYDLAKKKGYELIYTMKGSPNAFFVDERYYSAFGIADNSPAALWRPPPFRGKRPPPLIPKGREYLRWKALKIRKKFVER